MLNRKHPYLCFFLGMVLCGLKFPFNWLSRDNESRQSAMEASSFGILDPDPRMVDAWDRIESPDQTAHDLTNLAIEWTRRWVPYSTKFLCSIIVYGAMAAIGLLIAF